MNVSYFEKDGVKYQTYIDSKGQKHTRKNVDKRKTVGIQRLIYKEWRYMRKRCQAKNAPYSRYYYKKGIRVCDEWYNLENGFTNFYNWAIHNGYVEGYSLDRIDSSKNYCPENCRWLTVNENRALGTKQVHFPKWEYRAFNKEENILLIFYKAIEFKNYTGLDERRVSDGCKTTEYVYKGWKFDRRAINLDYYESLETISTESTLDNELPAEVRIIRLPIKADKDIVHTA